MKKETINIEVPIFVWECKCGQKFSIISYLSNSSWINWGNKNYQPYCPHCGLKIKKELNKTK